MNQFKRKIIQRFAFAIYILIIFYSVFEIYNIIFDYYGYLEMIMNYDRLYFIAIQVLIILNVIDFLEYLMKKIKEKP